jgi:hypothetical protein
MPMIYNGQEAGNRKRLAFFERDAIQWQPSPYAVLYKKLLALKKQNTALWNGQWGATMVQVPNSAPKQVFSFVRQNAKDKVFAVFNLSGQPVQAGFRDDLHVGGYRDFTTGETVRVDGDSRFDLAPWSYRILVRAD